MNGKINDPAYPLICNAVQSEVDAAISFVVYSESSMKIRDVASFEFTFQIYNGVRQEFNAYSEIHSQ